LTKERVVPGGPKEPKTEKPSLSFAFREDLSPTPSHPEFSLHQLCYTGESFQGTWSGMKSCPTCRGTYPANYAVCPQDGTPLEELGTWSEGSIIRGKYRILSKVGQGGMGTVYKSLHLAFNELRALKVISRELLGDELFLKRFKHEAVITHNLQHPNAVRVDDIDEAEDGRPFIVMEYIEGRSLRKLIREEGPLAVPRVCSVIKQVAAALDAAHRINMVHRDIKPENIVLIEGPGGEQAKVLDFGIAKVKEARLGDIQGMTLTGTGVVVGTPQYMSPEQAMGKRGNDLDGRSDLYSLGVVMYQMLTGELPFKAETTVEMLLAHVQQSPAPIQSLHPDLRIPERLAALTMRLLEKNPDRRPATAQALIEEIERAEEEWADASRAAALQATAVVTPREVRAAESMSARNAALPAPPLEQRPVAPAELAPPPPQTPAVVFPPPKESRRGLWVAVLILAAGLGGGGWYFLTRLGTPGSGSGHEVAPSPSQTPSQESPRVQSPSPAANTPTPARQDTKAGGDSQVKPKPQRHPPKMVVAQEPSAPIPAVDPKKIKAAIAEGDVFFRAGEYDDAIAAYQRGLALDPSNSELHVKIAKAQNAKQAEQKYLH
jgi:serine/threonine protein kinase